MAVYEYSVKDIQQNPISLSQYQGKVLLVVNTATRCGFTPQYEGLEALYKKYKEQGLEILDFPCNQFMNQAPESDEEIQQFCQLNYSTTFPSFAKLDVNGKNAEPLFVYLKEVLPKDEENEESGSLKKTLSSFMNALKGSDIKWNFTKFLVDRSGQPVARFSPTVKPEALAEKIAALL